MILRRISSALKRQDWATFTIEFILVVVGVLVALQFDNWNKERLQTAQHRIYLERLHNDFIAINKRIDKHFGVYQRAIDGGEYLLSITRASDAEFATFNADDRRIKSAFAWVYVARIPPPVPATYTEMLAGGQLSNLKNQQLRDKLAEYARLTRIWEEISSITLDTVEIHTPILYRYFDSNVVSDATNLAGIVDEVLDYDLEGMRTDKEFAVSVRLLVRNVVNTLEQRKIQRALIKEIIRLIDAQLKK